MKEYTTAEIFEELWKRIEYDAQVSEELASESNELQQRINKTIKEIEKYIELCVTQPDMNYLLNILKGENDERI